MTSRPVDIERLLDALKNNAPKFTCIHCGYTGTKVEVSIHYEYIGGIGNTAVGSLCNDSVSCWKRWDEANGFREVRE